MAIDLGFPVAARMAEKPYERYKKGQGGGVVAANHNGRILDSDVSNRLYALALERYEAGLHPTMANAITCVMAQFWCEWKVLTNHIQAREEGCDGQQL